MTQPQRSRSVGLDRAPDRGRHPAVPPTTAPPAALPPASASADVDPEVNLGTRVRASVRDQVNVYVVTNKRSVPGLSQGKLTEVALRRLFAALEDGSLPKDELAAAIKEIG